MLRLLAMAVIALLLVLVVGDFVRFSENVATLAAPDAPTADAIVVLTGGPDRIAAAISLLKAQTARRMLITGVDEQTTEAALRRHHNLTSALFSCCIDIGHDALDTRGNAREAHLWAEEKGYRSLIVVTNAFHMPRTLLEFRAAMPNTRLIAYPVRDPGLRLAVWYRHQATLRTLLREYPKFLLVRYG